METLLLTFGFFIAVDNLKSKIADGTADPEEVARFAKEEPKFYEVK